MNAQTKSNTISWQIQYDYREPRTTREEELDKMRTLRWELDVDPEINYTLEELEEMADGSDRRDHEG